MKKAKMNAKNLMVSFVIVAMALVLVSTVSAYDVTSVTVDGMEAYDGAAVDGVSVIAGETATVKVYFTAEAGDDDSDITVTAILEGEDDETEAETTTFDVVAGSVYRKVLDIKVPELEDDTTGTVDLTIEIDGEEVAVTTLDVQRTSYDVAFKSIRVADQSVEAGETFPVDILVENNGYNDLEELYITARIADLGVEQTFYFGDLDVDDSTNQRIELEVPSNAVTGTYLLEVEVSNEDATLSKTVEVVISNEIAVKSGNDLILLNPTDKPVAYKVVYNEKEVVESVNAGESVKVAIEVPAGEYSFDVKVLSMDGKVVSTTTFSGTEEATATTFESPVVILTVVLAIVFLVLLVVLIVLITKKPEKTDEFGESYY